MGLFIAKQIIAKHNGKIKATSEGEGMGSIFTVILPVWQKDKDKDKIWEYI